MLKKPVAFALACAFSGAASANDADLAAIKRQIEDIKQSYEQRIAKLEAKLASAEAKAERADQQATAASAAVAAKPAPVAGRFNPDVSLILQGKYLSAKDIDERGPTGFWKAGGHDDHGHGQGLKRGWSAEHTELVLSASVDPYWRGQAILGVADGEVEVEEAWFQATGLGHGLGLKGGRFRSGIGYLNEQHAHAWDFADAPLVYQAFFGSHGSYAQDGLQLKWLAPTPMFLEFGAEVGRGQNFPGSDRNKNGSGAGAVFATIGGDVGTAHSWRAGLSYLRTATRERETEMLDNGGLDAHGEFAGRARTWGANLVWKWAPDGNPKYRNFKFQTEYFQRRERGALECHEEDSNGAACDGVSDTYRRNQSGWYAQAVYQFTPNWRIGYRYDRLRSGTPRIGGTLAASVDTGSDIFVNFRPTRHSAMVDYSWSEFSRVRLQFARDRSMQGITDNQVTLQYIMSLGAHGAHKF